MTAPHRIGKHTLVWLDGDGRWARGTSAVVHDGDEGLLVNARRDRPHTEQLLEAARAALPDVHIGHLVVTDAATHRHGGHAALAGAEVHVSTRVAAEIAAGPGPVTAEPNSLLDTYLRRALAGFEPPAPVFAPGTTFDGCTTVKLGTVPVELIDLGPAQSSADTAVWLPDDETLITGDLLSPGTHPAQWSGSTERWHAVCADLASMRPANVVPGRGPLTGVAGILEFRNYLEHLLVETRRRFDRGMPIEETAVDLPLRHWADWGCRENLAITVAHLYHEFGGDPTPPAAALTLAAEIAGGLRRPPRVRPYAPVDRDPVTDERLALTEGASAIWDEHRAQTPNILLALVRHPHLYEQTVPIARGVVTGVLPARDREIVILRGAWNCTAPYQWNHHLPIAASAGLSAAEIDALSHPVGAGTWSPREQVLITALDELHEWSTVTDETWRALAAHYSPVELIELVTLCGEYRKISFQVNAWRMPLEPWAGPYRLPSGWPGDRPGRSG
ncbi:carboxymuconolactone decarboxylase family protein [Lentzea sp. CA-135723]|uniref:carboxymuconolactone decarboxylase family protein n=1 Tax=Lentzea sp. CA-135723 TaxID=3239950 RepID=UPI003D913431